ncbi:uncharacterized protein IUM83_15263 [Phytophthora cinnamomi]|uniref:uncharacterized protein n=1 Tax=Phytophthora cinnamomi TaxID=4785 RepID=UPI00355A9BCA|nr:hypothetical protein IUM83_15263 [Phytophthora cinnamomi]
MELNLRLPLEFSWMDEERPPFVPGPIPPVSRMYMRYVPHARLGARRVLEATRDPTTMEGSVADGEREAKAESDAWTEDSRFPLPAPMEHIMKSNGGNDYRLEHLLSTN